jgi:hypothetical protein
MTEETMTKPKRPASIAASNDPGPTTQIVTDSLTIDLLRDYRAADELTKAAMMRFMERVALEKMPMDLAGGLFRLERVGTDPDYIAAWRRQRLTTAPGGAA